MSFGRPILPIGDYATHSEAFTWSKTDEKGVKVKEVNPFRAQICCRRPEAVLVLVLTLPGA
jgi:hypothetical protein